jgi:hypothetical protein
LFLGREAVGTDETVAVEGRSVTEADVQHSVAVERPINVQRGMQRIFGIAQIDAVQVVGNLAFDRDQVVGVPFSRLRTSRAGPVGILIVGGQRGRELADKF